MLNINTLKTAENMMCLEFDLQDLDINHNKEASAEEQE
jgi:hypothetical protein